MAKHLDQMRHKLRTLHHSIRTEDAYVLWARQFIMFHGKMHPKEMGEKEIGGLLTYLAVERNVAAATQTQALSALLLLKVVLVRTMVVSGHVVRSIGQCSANTVQ